MVSVKLLLLCLLGIFFCSHHTSLHSICVAFANLIMQCRMNSCIKLQNPDFISTEHVHFLFQQAAALLHTLLFHVSWVCEFSCLRISMPYLTILMPVCTVKQRVWGKNLDKNLKILAADLGWFALCWAGHFFTKSPSAQLQHQLKNVKENVWIQLFGTVSLMSISLSLLKSPNL